MNMNSNTVRELTNDELDAVGGGLFGGGINLGGVEKLGGELLGDVSTLFKSATKQIGGFLDGLIKQIGS